MMYKAFRGRLCNICEEYEKWKLSRICGCTNVEGEIMTEGMRNSSWLELLGLQQHYSLQMLDPEKVS